MKIIGLFLSMALSIKEYKRIVVLVVLSLFLWVTAVVLNDLKLNFISDSFQLASVCVIVYIPFIIFLKKKKILHSESVWLRNELYSFISFIGFLCLIGVIESLRVSVISTMLFSEILVFILIVFYIKFRNKNSTNNGKHILKKWGAFRSLFWLFGVFITVLLIVSVLRQYKPVLDILDPFYFLYVFVFFIDWIIRHFNSTIQLKNEKAKTELMHLKSQVNPHFFFNMLNNLYGLVGTDAKKAQDLILQLSDMMRYSIYEGQKETVALSEEVTYLQNYIALHKMRYHKTIDVVFNHRIEEKRYKIMPLLFIIILENAFKHGVENLRENAYVHINMTAKNNEVLFDIENNFDPTIENEQVGIGLINLKRRLELVYPNSHVLTFLKTKNNYKAHLNIKGL